MTVLSAQLLETVRSKAAVTLKELEAEASTSHPVSWIDGTAWDETTTLADEDHAATITSQQHRQRRFFNHTGFIRIPNFATSDTVAKMKEQMTSLVESSWHPNQQQLESFGTDEANNVARGDYFLDSADRVHFFAEPGALSEDGQTLKPEYTTTSHGNDGDHPNNKLTALNKAGHGLHLLPHSIFHDYCTSSAVTTLVTTTLGWKDPVVPQSMYIFKQARTGGAVHSHQDSTFLWTTPRQTCLGLWLAVDDASLHNGCLWVRPKSHATEGTRRHYQRNVDYFVSSNNNDDDDGTQKTDPQAPKFVMHECLSRGLSSSNVPWDGDLPDNGVQGLLEVGFIPIECQAGDLLAFCGELDHLSLPNTSDAARHTFQLHMVEGSSQGVEWSKLNWLQYPDDKPFLRLKAVY